MPPNAAKRRRPRLRIRHKIILSIYLVLFPMLIFVGGFTYYRNYSDMMEENTRRYRTAVQALDENISYFERDLTDILTYFCVDDEILRVLGGDVSNDDRLFWTTHAPMEFIRGMLAIKSQITTLALYPENGLAPFYVSRDASVPVLDIGEIRGLAIYQKAVEAQGDIIWDRADMGDAGLFAKNQSDKILLCREIFDLSKRRRLGFIFLGVHVAQYQRMCENALLYENEDIVILGEELSHAVAPQKTDPALVAALAQNPPEQRQDRGDIPRYGGNYIFTSGHRAGGRRILYISPEDNWKERANQSLAAPMILGAVLLAGIWPLSIMASRIISRPLNRLYNSMNRFKEGDFDAQIFFERPTALICINDLVALGALSQLHRMNLRIPEDIAVIGCDNHFFSPHTYPPLTTVDLHPAEHGRVAVQQLISAITDTPLVFSQLRPATLIVRESCGAGLGPRAL